MTLYGWQNIKIQLLCNSACCLVAVVYGVCFPSYSVKPTRKLSQFPPCWIYTCLSLPVVFSFSWVFCLYCVFSPNACNIITGHLIHWPFLIQLHADTFTHTLHSLSLAAPPFLSRSVTHINSPTPPPQTNLSRSLHWPPITRSHSLETIVKQLKHSGSIKSHIIHVGAEDCKNPTGRKLWTRLRGWQSSRRKKTAMCPNCRLTAMPILYYTSQPLFAEPLCQ